MQYLTLTQSTIFGNSELGLPYNTLRVAVPQSQYPVLVPSPVTIADPVPVASQQFLTVVQAVPDWVTSDPTYTKGVAAGTITNLGAEPENAWPFNLQSTAPAGATLVNTPLVEAV